MRAPVRVMFPILVGPRGLRSYPSSSSIRRRSAIRAEVLGKDAAAALLRPSLRALAELLAQPVARAASYVLRLVSRLSGELLRLLLGWPGHLATRRRLGAWGPVGASHPRFALEEEPDDRIIRAVWQLT